MTTNGDLLVLKNKQRTFVNSNFRGNQVKVNLNQNKNCTNGLKSESNHKKQIDSTVVDNFQSKEASKLGNKLVENFETFESLKSSDEIEEKEELQNCGENNDSSDSTFSHHDIDCEISSPRIIKNDRIKPSNDPISADQMKLYLDYLSSLQMTTKDHSLFFKDKQALAVIIDKPNDQVYSLNLNQNNKHRVEVVQSTYENSIDATSGDPIDRGKEGIDKKKENISSIKNWKAVKKLFNDTSSSVKYAFELPRQQQTQNNDPEVMQFKASQQLSNVNGASSAAVDSQSSNHQQQPDPLATVVLTSESNSVNMTTSDKATDGYTPKDYHHAIQATINNPSMLSKRRELGEMIFKNIPKQRLAEYFIGLIKHVNEDPNIKVLKVKNEMTVLSLLVQSFLAWLLSLKYAKGKNNGKAELSKEAVDEIEDELASVADDAESVVEESNNKTFPNAIQFSENDKRRITEMLASIEFPLANKVLHLASKALQIPPSMIVEIVRDLASKGQASFSSLIIVLSEPILNKLPLWPELLLQCLLLGAVTSTQVESFAAPLSESERNDVRENLIAAEKWACSIAEYTAAFEKYTHQSSAQQPTFDVYRNRILALMADLKHKNRGKTTFDSQAAIGIIRTTALKRYKKNEVNNEQLLDLIIAVLKLQPSLKNYVIKLIEKTYNDVGLASRIKQLDFRNTKLNLPFADADLHEVRDKYLSIPKNVNINFVNNAAHLKILVHQFEEVAKSDYPYVGLDAEWNPYLSKSRASILQLAFRDVIYIIDLDALIDSKELIDFFEKLFGNEKICKIGFKFSEDLMQLRGCAPNCLSLYQPKNLICIQTLFFDLVNTCHNKIGNDLDGLVVASAEPFVANPEIAALEAELADPEFDETDIIRTREKLKILLEGYRERDKIRQSEQNKDIALNQIKYMGLALVCARILGKKLDKSEQCSVWSRRPLRKTQLRYAALDAYCILMILDKFLIYCNQKNLDISMLIAKQSAIKAPLPLFFSVAVS